MSTQDEYEEFILESIIKQILYSGQSPTSELIDSAYNTFINGKDLTKPLFDNVIADANQLDSASATKWNTTNSQIWQDLKIGYNTTFTITNKCINAFDRWRSESAALESQLKSLEDRIDNLLQTQLNVGTHYISEVFADTTQIDLTDTTAYVNIKDNNVSLNVSGTAANRINLNYVSASDITFTILSRAYLQSVVTAPGADLINALNDLDSFWQSRVYMSSSQQAVSAELKFKISDIPISISKISCKVHSSNTNSDVQITPLTSSDGVNFNQLNIPNVTTSVIDNASWSFPAISVTHIKFVMTKAGFDSTENQSYIYEFGMQDVSVYNLGFDNTSQNFFSNALFVPDGNQNPIPFHSVQLDTCEDIPDNTNIQYFLAALATPTDDPIWTTVDPLSRLNAINPSQINFGQKTKLELKNVEISFNPKGITGFVNPAANYFLVTLFENTSIISTAKTSTVTKYVLVNDNDRLLNYEIDGSINIDKTNLIIFRNVGSKGDNTLVRGIQRGWTYQEPYYISAFEVQNPNGFSIDFGDQNIILDGENRNGRINISQGVHNIQVRKNNWINISSGITDLNSLKAADSLFPYNQKLLIEGYVLNDPGNPYTGVDVFAGYYMQQAALVDFINNIDDTDYSRFAIDIDAIDTNKATPSTVFMVKSDKNTSDFLDELFTIRFTVKNQTFNYIKLQAILSTLDQGISPVLGSYKLKLSN